MFYCIYMGKHYPTPFQFPKFYLRPRKLRMAYKVNFLAPCKYSLPNEDMKDINKLFGISFGLHHTDSERFGWRYNPNSDIIEILEYRYINSVRSARYLGHIRCSTIHTLELEIEHIQHHISVTYRIDDNIEHTFLRPRPESFLSFISYTLGLYFGGNNPAPHTIVLSLTHEND